MEYEITYWENPETLTIADECATFIPRCTIGNFRFWFLDTGLCMADSYADIMDEPGFNDAFRQALELYEKYYQICFMARLADAMKIHDKDDLLSGLKKSRISIEECYEQYNRSKWMMEFDVFGNIKTQRAMVQALYSYTHPDPGYVYLVQSVTGHYKIGKTRNPEDRLRTFNVKLPFEVEMLHTIHCRDYTAAESELHRRFAAKRVNGEWFALTPDDVTAIKSIERL